MVEPPEDGRRERLYAARGEAASDPEYVAEMAEFDRGFDVAVAEGLVTNGRCGELGFGSAAGPGLDDESGARMILAPLGHSPRAPSLRAPFDACSPAQGSGRRSRIRRRMALWGTIWYLLASISTSTAGALRKMAKSPFCACRGT